MKNEYPTIKEEVKSLMKTLKDTGKAIWSGKPIFRTKEEQAKVTEICSDCEHYSVKGSRCKVCGCVMDAKKILAEGTCYKGKFSVKNRLSILIAAINDPHLEQTVRNLKEWSTGDVEIIVMDDSKGLGRRKQLNKAAATATGEYIYIIDSHCRVEPKGWDEILKSKCGEKDLVFSRIGPLKPDMSEITGDGYGMVYLNSNLIEKWWGQRDKLHRSESVVQSMGMTGCGFMMKRKRFWELGGYDASWSKYGGDGPEWSLKVWLSGGRALMHNDVVCGHVFETNKMEKQYSVDMESVANTYNKIRQMFLSGNGPLQIHSIDWLVGKFDPVPTWESTKGVQLPDGETVTTTKTVIRTTYQGDVLNVGGKPEESVVSIGAIQNGKTVYIDEVAYNE